MKKGSVGIVALVVLAGCGGGGTGSSGDGGTVTLTAAPNPAPYNSPVSVRWTGSNLQGITSSNFGVTFSQLSGSLSDNPGIDTTYQLTARANSGATITKAATVHVTKSTKSVLIVGNAAVSGPNQVLGALQTITSGAVTMSATVPASTNADVIVLHNSAALSISDQAAVKALLRAGKSVIFIGTAVTSLAGGSNISAVGSYLAGATGLTGPFGPGTLHVNSAQGFVPVSSTLYHTGLNSIHLLTGVSTLSDTVIVDNNGATGAMAYRVPTGGRTGFVQTDGVGSDADSVALNAAFLSIARWCMDGA